MKINTLIILFIVSLVIGCEPKSKEVADLVIFNGPIYTVNNTNDIVSAVAVKNDKIVALGDQALEMVGENTTKLDLDGKVCYPGFIEGHAHIMGIGDNLVNIDLMQTKSYAEVIEAVKQRAAVTPKGEWILGRGWHQDKWVTTPEDMFNGFPTHHDLSEAVPDHPVWLKHASGHASLANAKAMEITGVDAQTPNPDGGEVFKGLDGRPTGLMNETANFLIFDKIPSQNKAAKLNALNLAMDECLKNGLTSFHQAGSPAEDIALFQELAESGALRTRLYVMLGGRYNDLLETFFEKGPFYDPNNFLTIRSVKLYADGALGSRGAWLLAPYEDDHHTSGHNVVPMDTIRTIAESAYKAGFQVCTHAIGDRANREVLDIYEKIWNDHQEKQPDLLRFRIEHAQHIDPEDLPRFEKYGIVPAMQAVHMSSDRPWAIDRLGKQRIEEGAYMWRDLLDRGVKVVNGTDAPVEPLTPFASYFASVTRKTLKGQPEGGYEPEQKMSREEALRSYTIYGAYGAFEEDIKGSIEVGKLADFTILDRDILKVPEEEILATEVEMTIVGGEVLYSKGQNL